MSKPGCKGRVGTLNICLNPDTREMVETLMREWRVKHGTLPSAAQIVSFAVRKLQQEKKK